MTNNNEVKNTFKNTGLVGGSQVLTIVINLIKTKVVAILLGPIGIGLIQLFSSTLELLSSLFGLGLSVSGVRSISEEMAKGDYEKLSRTVVTIKRWLWFSGIVGVVFTFIVSKKISSITFGTEEHWIEISLLSITIIFSNLALAHSTLVRGVRNILDYIKLNIFSAVISTILAIPIYYYFRDSGIVPVLFVSSLITYLINLFFSSKIKLNKVKVSFIQSYKEGGVMIKLGLFTVVTGVVSTATLYYVRITIGDELGIGSVGYYSVAISLAVTYMSIIFNAMSADYFPKLGGINNDDVKVNRAVLEQTKIVLLLGMPLVVLMYTFSELIIQILYSNEFLESIKILQWMLLSVFIKFIGYPIGYVFLAKGKSAIFIFTQTFWNALFLGLVLFSFSINFGLEGVGMAYTLSYFIGYFVNYYIFYKLTNFKYDNQTKKYIFLFSLVSLSFFLISYYYSSTAALILKVLVSVLLLLYNYRQIEMLIDVNLFSIIKSKLFKR